MPHIFVSTNSGQVHPSFPSVSYLVTDVSGAILRRAESGVYSALEVSRGLSEELKKRYFEEQSDGAWRVRRDLQRSMTFRRLNLLDPFVGLGPFDVILCRNVLIYQSIENRQDIVRRLADQLEPSGLLLMGAAESLFGVSDEFKQTVLGSSIFYELQRKKAA